MTAASLPKRQNRFISARPAIAAAALSLLVYVVSLHGTYVYDDLFIAKDDPRLASASHWKEFWTKDYFNGGIDHLYRPLVSMSYAIEKWTHGDIAWPFHLVNWLMHAAVAAAVADFTRRFAGAAAAYIAGLLFAAHPIHVEAVANIVGRAELACALFILLALILFLRRPLTPTRAVAVFGCEIAAILSKEQGLLLPPMLLLAWWLLWRPRGEPSPRERSSLRLLAICVLWATAGYMFGREHFLKFEWDRSFLDWIMQPMVRSHGVDRLLMPVVILGHYTQLMLLPLKLSPDYGSHVIGWAVRFSDPFLWTGFAAAIIWFLATIACLARADRFPAFCLICCALAYGMVSNTLTLIGVNMAERLAYLPSVFFLIAIGALLAQLPRMPRIALMSIVLALASVRTVTYATLWNNPLRLYKYALANHPNSAQINVLVAEALVQAHQPAAAEELLLRAASQMPDCWTIWNYLGIIAMDQGRFEDADRYLRRAFELDINVMKTYARLDQLKAATRASTRPAAKANSPPDHP